MAAKVCYVLHGIVPVINTPFDDALDIDVPSLERLLERGIADGITGCIVPAVASEVDKLSPAERRRMIELVTAIVGQRIQVIAGCSSEQLADSVDLARHALQAGCTGILCRVPSRLNEHDAAIFDFFRELGATSGETLMIQDLAWTGYGMKLDLILRMFEEIPAFRCLKVETVPAGVKYSQVLEATSGSLNVSAGWAIPQMIEALDRGVHAFNTTAINRPFVHIYRLHHAGRRAEARTLFDRVVPYLAWSHQHIDISVQFLKRYCKRSGLFSTTNARPPILPYDLYHERCGAELIESLIAIEDDLGKGEQS
ncbi:MAG TPA: dihydrodipicolinate synthase family protein [Bryobacteraceae bacterium]|nr:dihydrodipicolinate synthase family protein [Bryobacteraceae bacterium]